MAKYLNKGRPPGSYVAGYPFFYCHEEAEFPPDVVPSKGWVALDEEAVKAFADHLKMKVEIDSDTHVAEFLTTKPAAAPASDADDGERTLADLSRMDSGVSPAKKAVIMTGPAPGAPRGRASDKSV